MTTRFHRAGAYRLAGLGCEFIVANNGMEALSQARQFKPDLILLDILLPTLTVCPFARFCAAQPSTKKTPVIFMSALSSEVTNRTVAVHADDFFIKAAQPGTGSNAASPICCIPSRRCSDFRRGRYAETVTKNFSRRGELYDPHFQKHFMS